MVRGRTMRGSRPDSSGDRSHLGGSFVGAAIKVGGAALAFSMFITLSQAMDVSAFGAFSAAFAAASAISFFAPLGQQSAILRFWPQLVDTDASSARAILRRASVLVATSSLVSAGILLVIGEAARPLLAHGGWDVLVLPTALLAAALTWTEFTSAAFRARRQLVFGLLPRDIVWRAMVFGVGAGWLLVGGGLSASYAVLTCAILLLVVAIPHTFVLVREIILCRDDRAAHAELLRHRASLPGLWGITSLVPALNQAGTLVVAAMVGPETAGAVFAAERMARLIEVVQDGINHATAPLISAGYRQGTHDVQRLSATTALTCSVAALAAIIAATVFGQFLLGLFDTSYATQAGVAVLVLFCLGLGVDAFFGPSGLVLQMAGAQNALLRLVLMIYPLGLLATAVSAFLMGPIGAALGVAGTVSIQAMASWLLARRHLGIDTSVLGLLPRRRRQPPPVAQS